jgi:hypothetical protein
MKNKQRLFWTGVLVWSGAIWLIGCSTTQTDGSGAASAGDGVCLTNKLKGLAIITCQPMDQEVSQGQQAVFKVKATGKNLAYQWYFKGNAGCGEPVGAGTSGGRTQELTVGAVSSAKGGFYWCEIDSEGALSIPVRTRTRDAHLGIRLPGGTVAGDIQVLPPAQATMPPGNSGTVCAGDYCAYVNYGGANGYDPNAGLTIGYAKVRVNDEPNFRPANTYRFRWVNELGGNGCATNGVSPNTDRKQFPINANRKYWFTVYFKDPCPAPGSTITFEGEFTTP